MSFSWIAVCASVSLYFVRLVDGTEARVPLVTSPRLSGGTNSFRRVASE